MSAAEASIPPPSLGAPPGLALRLDDPELAAELTARLEMAGSHRVPMLWLEPGARLLSKGSGHRLVVSDRPGLEREIAGPGDPVLVVCDSLERAVALTSLERAVRVIAAGEPKLLAARLTAVLGLEPRISGPPGDGSGPARRWRPNPPPEPDSRPAEVRRPVAVAVADLAGRRRRAAPRETEGQGRIPVPNRPAGPGSAGRESGEEPLAPGLPRSFPSLAAPAALHPVDRRVPAGLEPGDDPAPTAGPAHPRCPAGRPSALDGIFDRLTWWRRSPVPPEVAKWLVERRPVVVLSLSRKGGVGKTTHAAAIACCAAEALAPAGLEAALVDMNLGNPDTGSVGWGLEPEAVTVRSVIDALAAGRQAPVAALLGAPGMRLRVYPESRSASEAYSASEIALLHRHLAVERAHPVIVVDLPNRLPDLASAEGQVVAGWLPLASVAVIPSQCEEASLRGLIEYQAEVARLRRYPDHLPVVVPYLVPRDRRLRTHPRIQALLTEARARAAAWVEIPCTDRVRIAALEQRPVTTVSGRLRRAYLALTFQVAVAALRR